MACRIFSSYFVPALWRLDSKTSPAPSRFNSSCLRFSLQYEWAPKASLVGVICWCYAAEGQTGVRGGGITAGAREVADSGDCAGALNLFVLPPSCRRLCRTAPQRPPGPGKTAPALLAATCSRIASRAPRRPRISQQASP